MSTRILVIEDNPTNLELMAYLLRQFGFTVLEAHDGEEGLAQLQQALPDLIICDVQLPGIDGYEIALRLKQQPRTRSIPLLAVTALAMVGDREKLLASGFDGYLSKPIDTESFVPHVERYLRNASPSAAMVRAPAAPAPSAVDPPHRARILAVDDQAVNLSLTRSIFEPVGYEVLTANGQTEALALARRTRPALILTDVCMQDGSGYDLVSAVRADPDLAATPVILITSTYHDEHSRLRGLAAGANRYLFRPIESSLLLAEVDALLQEPNRG